MVYASAPLTDEILEAVERHWGLAPAGGERLHGGEESTCYRVADHVIRIGPRWRSDAEIEWAHAVASHAAAWVPEAIAPLPASSGATVVGVDGRPVSVWPLCPGVWADDEDDQTRTQAAGLLARLHNALADMSPGPRPGPGPVYAQAPDLDDPELDGWLEAFDRDNPGRRPLHGDFYAGNTLVDDGRIVGLLDWDESFVGPPERELAWAAWEWGGGLDGPSIDGPMVFVAEYERAGGPARAIETRELAQLVRERIRREVRYARSAAFRSVEPDADDRDYEARQLEAFAILSEVR